MHWEILSYTYINNVVRYMQFLRSLRNTVWLRLDPLQEYSGNINRKQRDGTGLSV